jgi:hypothetical protein
VPLESRLRPLGLRLDAATANMEVRSWLRDVANRRVHATTGRVPADVLVEERGVLLPLAAPWSGLVPRPVAAPVSTRPTPRPAAPVIQHPLSIYEDLLAPRVLQ